MNLRFTVPYYTEWGQKICVCGSTEALGNWDPWQAPEMSLHPHQLWELFAHTDDPSSIEYKYILRDERNQTIFWEYGPNRNIAPVSSHLHEIHLTDYWRPSDHKEQVWNSKLFTNVLFKRASNGSIPHTPLSIAQSNIYRFQIYAPRVAPHQAICVVGNHPSLGNWDHDHGFILNSYAYPLWRGELEIFTHDPIEYKYAIINLEDRSLIEWEKGANRITQCLQEEQASAKIITDNLFRHAPQSWKGTGVALPVFSLRTHNSAGTGEFLDIPLLVDWAEKTGMKIVQLLPINDTVATHTWVDSYPYAAISVFALHPMYLNMERISKHYQLPYPEEYQHKGDQLNILSEIDYEAVTKLKSQFYKEIFDQVKEEWTKEEAYTSFWSQHKDWLIPYAAFSYLRDKYQTPQFDKWPEYSIYTSSSIKALTNPSSPHYDDIAIHYFIQYHLHLQLSEAVEYAHNKRIALKGDIPIGIYRHSVDAWVAPEIYHMGAQAGAPPDAFAVNGQNWGFPTYNWERMAENGFQWWRKRLSHMAQYFDAYRIDHILGFFRIWEIPLNSVEGIMGHFNPSMPLHINELQNQGLHINYDRYCKPFIREFMLEGLFGHYTEIAKQEFLYSPSYEEYRFKDEFQTQGDIELYVDKREDWSEEMKTQLKQGLFSLMAEIILIDAPFTFHEAFNPRIALQHTRSFQHLDNYAKSILNRVYDDFFYHRHEAFWRDNALAKLPAILNATDMLVCGEDLGMVPDVVPSVMDELGILSLEIQRMPKNPKILFGHPSDYPYLSICSTSTHDMPTLRAWWEQDRNRTQHFFEQVLHHQGEAPFFCEPWICKEVIEQHLFSPAMWTILPIQDLLAMDGKIRRENPFEEQINDPSNPRHYWRYRLHMNMEDLLEENDFNNQLKELVAGSGRLTEYMLLVEH